MKPHHRSSKQQQPEVQEGRRRRRRRRRSPYTTAVYFRSVFVIICTPLLVLVVEEASATQRGGGGGLPPYNYYNQDVQQDYYLEEQDDGRLRQQQQQEQPYPYTDEYNNRQYDQMHKRQQPPPPRPPPGMESGFSSNNRYNPIHYEFQSKNKRESMESADGTSTGRTVGSRSDKEEKDDDAVPLTYSGSEPWMSEQPVRPQDADGGNVLPKKVSPRRDAVTRYMSTSKGRLTLRLSSTAVGAGFGAFIGKSLVNHGQFFAWLCAVLFFFCTYLRNPYGEWVRALGLTLIYTVQRSRSVRKTYPTWIHVKSSLGITQRQRFPPATDNPWSYRPSDDDDDIDFNMLYTVIAMAFVGSTCGGNLPMLPSWMGALGGAGLFAFATTLPNSRGDLSRTMGMRVIAIIKEIWETNRELQLLNKTAVVSGKLLDKAMILDRKHRVKDRIVAGATFLYGQILRAVNNMPIRNAAAADNEDERDRRRAGGRRPPPGSERDDYDRRGRRPPPDDDWSRSRDDDGGRYRRGRPPPEEEGAYSDRRRDPSR